MKKYIYYYTCVHRANIDPNEILKNVCISTDFDSSASIMQM